MLLRFKALASAKKKHALGDKLVPELSQAENKSACAFIPHRTLKTNDVTSVSDRCLQNCTPHWEAGAARRCSADGVRALNHMRRAANSFTRSPNHGQMTFTPKTCAGMQAAADVHRDSRAFRRKQS